MIESLVKHFEKYVTIDDEEIKFIRENIPVKTFQKNELILSQGEVSKAFYFIIEGSVRLYYLNNIEEKNGLFLF